MSNNDPYTRDEDTRFTMRVNTKLLDSIKEHAIKNKRSAAKQIEFILQEWLESNVHEE